MSRQRTQCTVRRNVVIELIKTMVETYQHPAYANVDMDDVVDKAKTQLNPEAGDDERRDSIRRCTQMWFDPMHHSANRTT